MLDKVDIDGGSGEQGARKDCDEFSNLTHRPSRSDLRRLRTHAARNYLSVDDIQMSTIRRIEIHGESNDALANLHSTRRGRADTYLVSERDG
jgi:hypothetical protein